MRTKNLLSKMLLLIAVMLMGAGTAWAEGTTATITFGKNDVVINAASVTGSDSKGNSWTITTSGTTSFTSNADYYQVGSSKNPATSITFTTTLSEDVNITAFSAKFGGFSGTAGDVTLKVGDASVGAGSLNATEDVTVSSTSSATGKVLTVTVTNIDKGVKVYNISYTYESASPLASISVDATNAKKEFYVGEEFTHDGAVVTATYENNSTKDVTDLATFSNPDMTTTGTKAITVSYIEGGVSKSTSYDIVVKTRTLTSLTLSGTYPTEFNQGGTFSYEGIVVTANYDDGSTKDVTESVTVSNPDLTTVGEQTVTVSYIEGSVTKTVTYDIMVNAYVQPIQFEIALNNGLFGTNYSGTVSGITDEAPVTGMQDNVTVTYAGSGSHYINNSQIRFYPNNKLTFEAPVGYNVTKIVFTPDGNWGVRISANEGTYTSDTKTWEGEAASVLFIGEDAISGRCDMSKVAITLVKDVGIATTVTINDNGILTDVFDGTDAGTLLATVWAENNEVENATVTWSGDNDAVATIDAATGAVTLVSAGTVRFTATYAGNDTYKGSSNYIEITVINSDPNVPGTETNPYTVAQAINAIDNGGNVTGVYVAGIVSQVDSYSSNAITYWISDDGTSTNQFEVYKGKGINGANFSSKDDIQVGDVVVVTGNITLYNSSIYEFSAGSQLVSHVGSPKLSIEPGTADPFTYEEGGDVADEQLFEVTGTNLTSDVITVSVTEYFDLGDNNGYGNSNLTISNGDAFGVRPKDNLSEGTYNGTLTIASEGATTITIDLTCTVTGYIAPAITATETTVNVNAAESNGTIELTYTKIDFTNAPEVRFFESDGTTSVASYDWLAAEINATDNTKLDYMIAANDGEARTAYMKVYALDNNGQDTWSDLITITQAAYVDPATYSLATSISSGKHYIITNGSDAAMGYDKGNNRDAVDITIENGTISVASDSKVYEFVIYGPDADGRYAIYDETSGKDGYLYAASSGSNTLKTKTELDVNGKWKITFEDGGVASIVAEGSSNRNVMQYNANSSLFSCYSSASQSDVYLYEKDGEATPTETIHVTDAKYATYYSENALDFEGTGLTAYVADQKGTSLTFEPVTKVPAYTGVLVKADAAGDYTISATSSINNPKSSDLKGVIVETTITGAGIYVLLNGDEGVGFYKTTKPEFTIGAHTAYLPKSVGQSRDFIAIDEATAINGIAAEKASNGEIYNLQGQRVTKTQKGLYIMNGKKVLVK